MELNSQVDLVCRPGDLVVTFDGRLYAIKYTCKVAMHYGYLVYTGTERLCMVPRAVSMILPSEAVNRYRRRDLRRYANT
jgi:hypothetical protein